MSKPETNIISVPLANAYLNLNQEKDEIRQYEGFNKLNAPFYGGNLSPMYKKFLGASGASSYTDENETVYTIENGVFTKKEHNGNTEVLKDDFQTYTAEETILDNRTYKWYYDSDNYAVITDTGSVTVVLHGVTVGTYNNFEKIMFNSNRAVIVLSTSYLFIFEGVSVTEINKITERYIEPTYTVFNYIMVVSLNNKLYGFYSDGTVEELTVTYNGDINITYGNTILYVEITEEGSARHLRNTPSAGNKTVDFSEINSDSTLNGELTTQADSSSHHDDKLMAWQINTNKTVVEWLYNDTNNYKPDVLSGFVLTPHKNTITIPSALCVSSQCLSNVALGAYLNYIPVISFFNFIIKYYGIYNVANAEINSITGNNIVIDLTIEKKTTLTSHLPFYNYDNTWWQYNIPSKQSYYSNLYGCMYSEQGSVQSRDFILTAPTLFNTYKNQYIYEIKRRIVNIELSGSWKLGEMKKRISNISLMDYYTPPNNQSYISPESEGIVVNYNTVFYSFNLSFIENAEDYNLNTTRGYAVNISDYFRVLVNSNYIAAVSMFNYSNCLGTLVSNFGTTGIEYIYAVSEDRLVYVDDKNKVHIIDVIEFSGNEIMTVLLGRYFVFNAIGVNCYDSVSRTWSRVGLDWNNRFVIADYSESADTKYYMTSAMFRTTDNNPSLSMLFNVDYLNKLPYTALTPQYAEDAVIQLYGTEDVNDSALYLGSFVFSSDEWTVYNDSDYDGMIAESNSDNNLLIPVSLFTTYITSYLNDIYAVMSDGFTPLYKNDNLVSTIKFNYYIGSLIQDLGLDAIFIIQGQYYRLSNKIIYAYSYSGGVLVDTQEICNVGSLVFVGASPSEAYFWSYANRTLYRFTGARIVESVVCADSINAIYGTLYDTTTSSLYLSTNLGLVVYNAFGNFILEGVGIVTELTSTKYGITFRNENNELYGLYYNAVDGETVIPVTLETSFYGSSSVQNVINDTLYLKIFNKDNISKGVIKFGGYIQQNYGETKEIVSKTVEVTSEQFDKITKNLLLRYQPDKQRGIGISWKIESDFPISFIGIGSSPTGELNVPKSNNPVITTQKYNI